MIVQCHEGMSESVVLKNVVVWNGEWAGVLGRPASLLSRIRDNEREGVGFWE